MNVIFSTISDPGLDKKISDGLHDELKALTQLDVGDLKALSLYAHEQDKFVGGAIILRYGGILWLDSIWVEPGYRKLGIGKQIMQEIFLQARHSNVQQLQLNTFFSDAHEFFLKSGFEDIAIVPDWKYGLTCYMMRKTL